MSALEKFSDDVCWPNYLSSYVFPVITNSPAIILALTPILLNYSILCLKTFCLCWRLRRDAILCFRLLPFTNISVCSSLLRIWWICSISKSRASNSLSCSIFGFWIFGLFGFWLWLFAMILILLTYTNSVINDCFCIFVYLLSDASICDLNSALKALNYSFICLDNCWSL